MGNTEGKASEGLRVKAIVTICYSGTAIRKRGLSIAVIPFMQEITNRRFTCSEIEEGSSNVAVRDPAVRYNQHADH